MGGREGKGGGRSFLGFNNARFLFNPPETKFLLCSKISSLKMVFPWRRGRLL